MISVVVPIYNEEELIPAFHRAVTSVMRRMGEDWETIFVNDGSHDTSLDLLTGIQSMDEHVVIADLSRNWGHTGAITAGLQTARGNAVIVMDGDFQDPPRVIPELVDAWRNGAEVVVGVRRSRKERRKLFAIFTPMFYRVLSLLADYPIPMDAGVFSLMDRRAVDMINRMKEHSRYLPGLRAWIGYKNAVVLYDREDRAAGEIKQNFTRLFRYAMDAITGFSYKPLRFCFLLSSLCSCFTVALVIAAAVVGGGLASIGLGVSAAVFMTGSLILLCLGILSEYLARIYDEVRDRPVSIIHKVYRHEPAGTQFDGSELAEEYAQDGVQSFSSRIAG